MDKVTSKSNVLNAYTTITSPAKRNNFAKWKDYDSGHSSIAYECMLSPLVIPLLV